MTLSLSDATRLVDDPSWSEWASTNAQALVRAADVALAGNTAQVAPWIAVLQRPPLRHRPEVLAFFGRVAERWTAPDGADAVWEAVADAPTLPSRELIAGPRILRR